MDIKLSEKLKDNDRYYVSFILLVTLALLLGFFENLTPWFRDIIVPSIAIYMIGTVLIAQIQNMIGNRAILREKDNFEGIHPLYFRLIVALHMVWFLLFLAFVLVHRT